MLTVTKTVRFDAAHILTNHQGLCRNLHGHTYRLDVSVSQKPGDDSDMVMDFKDLKRLLEREILDYFDHAFIYDETSAAESEIAQTIARHGMRAAALPFRSTAENIARFVFAKLEKLVDGLDRVTVWETPDSCASCGR